MKWTTTLSMMDVLTGVNELCWSFKVLQHSLLGTGWDCRQASPVPVPSSSSAMPLECVQNVVLHCLVEKCMDVPGKDVFLKAAYVAVKSQ